MALEGGESGKVRVSVPGSKMGEKSGVDIQVVIQTGYSTGYSKLLPEHTMRGGGNKPKKGG